MIGKGISIFDTTQEQARRQNCVLEKAPDGYTLYSNTTFVEAFEKTLFEIKNDLDNDPSFK